ncbi:MAG: hypothetical protein LUG66_08625 [Clostridiales bacterium]|nr:hypothetical protein [Clostridiales bacterium]
MRKILSVLFIGILSLLSVTSAFAGTTNISNESYVGVNGSAIGTLVSQDTSIITAKGGNVTITDAAIDSIKDSVIGTGVFVEDTYIDAEGRDVSIASADVFSSDGSYASVLIRDVYKDINARTK